ncbi:hypothetical protein [Methyloprofundus sp.]|uniref:hypothetical protein n=1 Tax=Methyloprofundus sp. TaxID=2020875 RepID=UPI003D0BDD66
MKQRHQTFVSFMLFMVNTMSWAGKRALVLSVQCKPRLPGNRCGFILMHNLWFFTMKDMKLMKQRHQTFVSFMLFMVNTMSWAGRRALVLSVQCKPRLPGNRCGFNLMHNPWFFTMKGIKIMKQRHQTFMLFMVNTMNWAGEAGFSFVCSMQAPASR